MNRIPRRVRFISLTAGVALALAACSGSEEPADFPEASADAPEAKTVETTPAGEQAAAPAAPAARPSTGRGGFAIPSFPNPRSAPVEALRLDELIRQLGEERCALCGVYTCVGAGAEYSIGARAKLGNSCTGPAWSKGCPDHVTLKDGSHWEYSGECNKC